MGHLTEEQMRSVEDYLEGRLSGKDRSRLEDWLQQSAEAREYLGFLQDLKRSPGELTRKNPPPDLTDRIMDRLSKPAPGPALPWAKAGIVFACIVLVFLTGYHFFPGQGRKESASNQVQVDLVLNAPGARNVEVVGDFSEWKRVPLTQRDGHWGLRLTMLPGRAYEYVFILNGRVLVTDPGNDRIVRDRHGDLYSILRPTTERSEATKMGPFVSKGASTALSTLGLCLTLLSPPAAYAEEAKRPFLSDIQAQAKKAGLTPEQISSLSKKIKELAAKRVPEKILQDVADQALSAGKGAAALKALDRLDALVAEGLAPEDAGKAAVRETKSGMEEKTSPEDQEMEKSLEKGLAKTQSAKSLTPQQLEEKLEQKRREWEEKMDQEKEIRSIQHEAAERAP